MEEETLLDANCDVLKGEDKLFFKKTWSIIMRYCEDYSVKDPSGTEATLIFLFFRRILKKIIPKKEKYYDSECGCGCSICSQIKTHNDLIDKINERAKEYFGSDF
ncbi:MAG: hypothetical protein PHS54_04120 [Clostridia bacterium]|nr:hypothetical protein [Clostridia bacterium]